MYISQFQKRSSGKMVFISEKIFTHKWTTLAEVIYKSYKTSYSLLNTCYVPENVHSLAFIYMILQSINFPFYREEN